MLMRLCLLMLALAVFTAAAPVHGGRIADLFSKGLFGLAWGATGEEIQAAFPGGSWKEYGPAKVYWVVDSRGVLNIERGKKSRLGFALNTDGRLSSVSIEFVPGGFDKWSELLLKSQEAFGAFRPIDDKRTSVSGIPLLEWDEDDGVRVVGSYETKTFGGGPVTLSIYKVNVGPPKTKEDLGFE